MNKKFKQLTERNLELRKQMQAIADMAKAEKRNLSEDESKQYEQLRSEWNSNTMEIQDIVSTEKYRSAHGSEKSTLLQLLRNARNVEGHTISVPACSGELRSAISAMVR